MSEQERKRERISWEENFKADHKQILGQLQIIEKFARAAWVKNDIDFDS